MPTGPTGLTGATGPTGPTGATGATGPIAGGTITVRQQDITNSNRNFEFYQLITTASPQNVTGITIEFLVNAEGNQSLDLDDVSLIVA